MHLFIVSFVGYLSQLYVDTIWSTLNFVEYKSQHEITTELRSCISVSNSKFYLRKAFMVPTLISLFRHTWPLRNDLTNHSYRMKELNNCIRSNKFPMSEAPVFEYVYIVKSAMHIQC